MPYSRSIPIRPIVILIPAYNPDQQLLQLVNDLRCSGFDSIIVVNDGSAENCAPVFDALEEKKLCSLLCHAVNLGKGRAIKTGLNYARLAFPDLCGVVTCDADGQHVVRDVVRVATVLQHNPENLVLGVREFDRNVPLRSRLGNVITRGIFYFLVGKYLSDTQTGLRGIPACFLPTLLRLEGEGYEYEMNMLIATKAQGIHVSEEKIDTVYIENNKSSHFNPLLDSMKIYFLLLRFSFSSLVASMLDFVLFTISYTLTSNILLSIFIGRYTIGPLVNFFVNRNYVFHHRERLRRAIIRYYLFATVMGICSFLLIRVVTEQFPVSVVIGKIIVETFLFIISFTIQRDYIFTHKAFAAPIPGRADKGP